MQQYADVITDLKGNVVPGALVSILNLNGSMASLFEPNGTTPLANPVTANDQGVFTFKAANGTYARAVSIGGHTFSIPGQIILDTPFAAFNAVDLSAPIGAATANTATQNATAFLLAEATRDNIYVPPGAFSILGTAPLVKKYWGPGTISFSGVGAATFTGGGLNDLTLGGAFVQSQPLQIVVKIASVGTPDTIAYSLNGGASFYTTVDTYDSATDQVDALPIPITAGAIDLQGTGVTLQFAATTGHTLNSTWSFKLTPHPKVAETQSGIVTKNGAPIMGVLGVIEANTFLGKDVFGANTNAGNQLTAVGYRALYSSTSGYANTAVGITALTSCTSGFSNTAVGADSLYSLTTGFNNASLGIYSGRHITTGQGNVSVGSDSNGYQTTGSNNTAVGTQTLYHNVSGEQNVAVGMYALRGGSESLSNGSTVSYGTAVGARALYFCRAGFNAAFGHEALYNTTTGPNNTGAGAAAGWRLTTGGYNVFLGYRAGYNALQDATSNNSIAIGDGAYTTGSNGIAIGSGVSARANTVFIGNSSHSDLYHYGHLNPQQDRVQTLGKYDGAYLNIHSTNITLKPPASVTPANNGEMTFQLTSNTSLVIKVKGSDGVVRSTVLTLA